MELPQDAVPASAWSPDLNPTARRPSSPA